MFLVEFLYPKPLFFEADSSKKRQASTTRRPAREEHKAILCALCRAPITFEQARIEVSGAHQHRFFNPRGIIFLIGCFRSAPGCSPTGPSSGEFTWFPGFLWRVVECASCRTHLGWSFANDSDAFFFGLILDRLVEGPSGNKSGESP